MPSHPSDYTILLVEDEIPLLRAIQSKLSTSGYDTVTARTVDQALDYIKDGVIIEAIWLDHFLMGTKTGIDFVYELKKHVEYKNLPVFVVANTGGPDTRHSYMRLGVAKYYIKSNHKLSEIIEDITGTIKDGRNGIHN